MGKFHSLTYAGDKALTRALVSGTPGSIIDIEPPSAVNVEFPQYAGDASKDYQGFSIEAKKKKKVVLAVPAASLSVNIRVFVEGKGFLKMNYNVIPVASDIARTIHKSQGATLAHKVLAYLSVPPGTQRLTFAHFFVLISRVTCLADLRFFQLDDATIDHIAQLRPPNWLIIYMRAVTDTSKAEDYFNAARGKRTLLELLAFDKKLKAKKSRAATAKRNVARAADPGPGALRVAQAAMSVAAGGAGAHQAKARSPRPSGGRARKSARLAPAVTPPVSPGTLAWIDRLYAASPYVPTPPLQSGAVVAASGCAALEKAAGGPAGVGSDPGSLPHRSKTCHGHLKLNSSGRWNHSLGFGHGALPVIAMLVISPVMKRLSRYAASLPTIIRLRMPPRATFSQVSERQHAASARSLFTTPCALLALTPLPTLNSSCFAVFFYTHAAVDLLRMGAPRLAVVSALQPPHAPPQPQPMGPAASGVRRGRGWRGGRR